MSGERDRRRRDEGGGDRDRERRRRDEGGGGKDDRDRERRRRDEGGGGGGGERDRDRRRREEEKGGGDRDRRRRDEEGARDKDRDRRRRDEAPRDDDREAKEREERRAKEREAEKARAADKGRREKGQEEEKGAEDTKKREKLDVGRSFGLTFNMYKAGRRVLEKYDKKCSYDQILDRGVNSSEFSTMLGKPGMPREDARALKEEAKRDDRFRKKPDPKEEGRRIMRDFYTTIFEWGGQPLPGELRKAVDDLEARYKQEKRVERERAEEKARQEAEAQQNEVADGKDDEDDEGDDYGDDFEDAGEINASAKAEVAELAAMMAKENQQATKALRDREKDKAKRSAKAASPKAKAAASLPQGAKSSALSHEERYRLKARATAWEKQYRRAAQLLRLMSLEGVSIDLGGIEPMTEYDLYIRNFGNTNTTQSSTQRPDAFEWDSTTQQTDRIIFSSKEAQCPEDLGLTARDTRGDDKQEKKGKPVRVEVDAQRLSRFLANCTPVFRVLLDEAEIRSSRSMSSSSLSFSNAVTSLCWSPQDGSHSPLIRGRGTVAIAFSRVEAFSHYLVTVHGPPTKDTPEDPSGAHTYDGLCLVWNINNPMAPDKALSAGGGLTTVTFGAQRAYLLYAGSTDGTVYLWDLREPDFHHSNNIRTRSQVKAGHKDAGTQLTLRMPSYSTDHLGVHKSGEPTDNHTCAVRRILPVGYNNILGFSSSDEASEQIATLDEIGNVNIWIVVEVHEASGKRNFVSQTDLGLNIFSRMKLFKTATVCTINPTRDLPRRGHSGDAADALGVGSQDDRPSTTLRVTRPEPERAVSPAPGKGRAARRAGGRMDQQAGGDVWQTNVGAAGYALDMKDLNGLPRVMAHDLEFQPDDAAQFVVATDTGFISHGSRYREGAVPANYRSAAPPLLVDPRELARENAKPYDVRYGIKCLAVHYSPVDSRMFLSGFADGSVSIYKTGWPSPLVTLQEFTHAPIIQARWSMNHKGVFWLLDGGGRVHMFDLMADNPSVRLKPVLTADCIIKLDGGEACPNDFELSPDIREAKLALSYDKGRVDLHVIKEDLIGRRGAAGYTGAWLDTLI